MNIAFLIGIFLSSLLFSNIAGFKLGSDYAEVHTRENTINYCIEKPADCKKEYDFNKTKVEIQKLQEGTAK
jgi:hypothetical protein